ncbi:hypothetical protein [Paracoccus aminophilus]|uniref:Uncharacterized protein n=1 Tax=Paracoccus aminophilus JCM 7686 TaxID=1367847 RepID=S5XZM1_PARAH|nr:hypothetical protein [Paracoccus aminophilus]AGT08890.1 hypothetical protein JCM7686_1789 [Paracoccus aminophilus JCM 7686]
MDSVAVDKKDQQPNVPQPAPSATDKVPAAAPETPIRKGTDNETWPDPLKGGVEKVPGQLDKDGKPVLQFHDERTGADVQIDRETNPLLYDYLGRVESFQSWYPNTEYAKIQQDEFGAEVLKRDDTPPTIPDLKDVDFAESRGGSITIADKDGKRTVVNKELTPETYKAATELAKSVEGIRMSEQHGYKNETGGTYSDKQIDGAVIGPANEVGPGLIRAEIPNDSGEKQKVVVSKDVNPGLYDRLEAAYKGFSGDAKKVDDTRGGPGLTKLDELDPLNMKTSESKSKDDDTKLTVSELAWRDTLNKWKDGIQDGSIGADDDRAKLYNALRGQAAAESGMPFVSLDVSLGQSTTDVTGADISKIVDRGKLDTKVNELFGKESVQKDYLAAQTEALKKLPNADEIHKKLSETAFSEEYVKHIADLKNKGQDGVAQADIARTYAGLAAFSPEEAGKFAQSTFLNGMTVDLDKIMSTPGAVSEENEALATKDTLASVLATLKKGGVDVPRRLVDTLDKFVNEFMGDKQQVKSFNAVLQELGDTFNKTGTLTQADIEKVANSKGKEIFKALNEKSDGAALSLLGELNSNGTLGSIGGAISLASGIYQAAGKGGSLADTPEERLAVAKDFVSFLGAGQHFANLGSNIIDKVKGTNANKMLGLDKTLPQIFSTDKPSGGKPFTTEANDKFMAAFDKAIDQAAANGTYNLESRANLSATDMEQVKKGMIDGYVKNPELPGSSNVSRWASAALRVMDAGANMFAGVADMVLGGLSLKKGVDGKDPAKISTGALQVAGGLFTFAGGGASAAALAGSAVGRALAGPFLGIGAVIGTVAMLPQMIIDDIKHNNQMNGYRDNVKDLFADLEKQGLLTEDGKKRFDFLNDYIYNYGQRDAPDDQSIFDYRREEYDFYAGKGHLPEAGFDPVKHEDYKGDGPNLDTTLSKIG